MAPLAEVRARGAQHVGLRWGMTVKAELQIKPRETGETSARPLSLGRRRLPCLCPGGRERSAEVDFPLRKRDQKKANTEDRAV